MENYLKNPSASNEESKTNPIKKPEGSKCVYEEKKGLKPIKKEASNPITQGKQTSLSEHIQLQPQAPKYQVPPEVVTENSSVREEFTKQTVVSPTFNSSVFKFEQGSEDSAQKHCFKSVEKRNDSISGILSYESGPSFKGGEITKPCDAAPNQIAKECKKILAEHQENKNYAGFKDRMLNHQWSLG